MYFSIICFFLACVGGCWSCHVSHNPKIVGGRYIHISRVPYTVQLRFGGSHQCGATIISSEWAVTAAHCLDFDDNPNQYKIRSGSSWRGFGWIHSVSKLIIHEKYDSSEPDYDIALIKVTKPFNIGNRNVKAARLPEEGSTPKNGTMARASGWGVFWVGTNWLTIFLKAVDLPIVDRKKCGELYEKREKITERMLCAGYRRGGKDACQGDSGGPLVTKKRVLVGVVSFGEGCGKPNFPGVYADVAYFRKWIRDNTGV